MDCQLYGQRYIAQSRDYSLTHLVKYQRYNLRHILLRCKLIKRESLDFTALLVNVIEIEWMHQCINCFTEREC